MVDIKDRLSRIFDATDCKVIFIANTNNVDSNFLYLTGFGSGIFEDSVLIASRKEVTCLVSSLDYGTALNQKQKNLKIVKWESRKQFIHYMNLAKKAIRDNKLGINASFLPHSYYLLLKKRYGFKKFDDVGKAFEATRIVKDDYEIRKIIKANRIARIAFSEIPSSLKEGITEREVARKFDIIMMENGADCPSFPTIVAFGKNSASPHHMPDNTKLKKNSVVLIDAGAKYQAYCSDITRTFVYKPETGQKYSRMHEIIEVVKDAQDAAFKRIKPGAKGSDIHNAAADYIDKYKGGIYKKGRFMHALGHSIGIDVHDGDGFSPRTENILKEGMVVSNEPGIYLQDICGVRIEDDILVTKNGAKIL